MGLRIQNNIAALNAHRNLTISMTDALPNPLRDSHRVIRINRAADDAAGLAISQAFRRRHRELQGSQQEYG